MWMATPPLKYWALERMSILPKSTGFGERLRRWVQKILEVGKLTSSLDHLLYIKQMTFPPALTLISPMINFFHVLIQRF